MNERLDVKSKFVNKGQSRLFSRYMLNFFYSVIEFQQEVSKTAQNEVAHGRTTY